MNKNKVFSFLFTAAATGAFTFVSWLGLLLCDRLLILVG